jgi:hypothetical protein
MSIFGYQTQDWLTGREGQGVWYLLGELVGPGKFIGPVLWQLFLALGLSLFGLSLIVRPYLRVVLVDLGQLFWFAALAQTFIMQGNAIMRQAELWRVEAGGYVYTALEGSDTISLDAPGGEGANDPIAAPADLDGHPPLRGWEAVAASYFLAVSAEELHQGVPPHDFRVAYCLYDPDIPLNDQDEENEAGCSPQKAWDEWDSIGFTLPITNVWGIPIDVSIELNLPIYQEHPENRQLGLRQAQAGVARLALGPVVALFPLLEANVGLMLTLAACFIYLSLPVMLLFGFFRPTASLAVGLMFQYLHILVRTLILQGLVALFLMVLVSVSVGGSLTAYLGLVGVGVIGGFFLTRMATATMKETMSQTFSAVGAVWRGTAVNAFGRAAEGPARRALGVAKVGAAVAEPGAASGAQAAAIRGNRKPRLLPASTRRERSRAAPGSAAVGATHLRKGRSHPVRPGQVLS